MKHLVVAAGQGLDYDWASDHIFVKTPMGMTGGRVTVVEDILKPGFHLARHHHRAMVEIFYVLDGRVTFVFADETLEATAGMTVTVPASVVHEVSAPAGARLITIFTPGGFDGYLAASASLTPAQTEDADFVAELGRRHDIWVD